MEKYEETRCMVFIDLMKAYDRIPKEIMWPVLEKKPARRSFYYGSNDLFIT
jgi:hypothetical protein